MVVVTIHPFTKIKHLYSIDTSLRSNYLMMQNKTTLFNVLQTLLFGLIAFLFWSNIYPAHLHFHEQFQLFNYSTAYFNETISLPGGIAHYISRFIVQFYYDSFLGPLSLTFTLLILQLLFALFLHILPSVSNKRINYTITFLPSIAIWGFLLNADAMPYLLIASILNLALVLIGISIKSASKRVVFEAISACLLFFISGGTFILYICLMASWEIIKYRETGKGVGIFFILLAATLSWLGIIAIGTLFYNYPYSLLLDSIGSYRYPTMDCSEKYVAMFVFLLVGIYFMSGISNKIMLRRLPATIAVVCMGILSAVYIYNLIDTQEESVLEYDYLTRTKQWDQIITKASQKAPSIEWELVCLNLAMAQKGTLCDKLFAYPQKGRASLLPIYEQDYMSPQFAGEAYLSIGLINTAQRFFFEAMEAIPDYQKSSRCYQRLATTNIVNGRYEVAALYLKKLSRTLYYREWANNMHHHLYNDTLIANDQELGPLRKGLFDKDFFMNEYKLEPVLLNLLNQYPNNNVAWQYLFALCLMDKNLNQLEYAVNLYLNIYPEAKLPVHVQEALLMQWLQTNNSLDGLPWQIDNQVKERLMQFVNALNQSPSTKEKVARKQFNNTFWCYALFG